MNTITQDQTGFMWFGTQDGLNRYDGENFTIFRNEPGNPNSLASGNFGAILQDSKGRLWLGTWGAGLDRLNLENGEMTHFGTGGNASTGFQGANTEFIFEDSAGDVWIGTERRGLNRFDTTTEVFEHFEVVADENIEPGNRSVKAMAESAQGRLFIGTDAGLFEMDRAASAFVRLEVPGAPRSGKQRIRSLFADSENSLWVGTRGDGLKRLDLETGQWQEFRHDPGHADGLSENNIARVFVDSTGAVWIATYDAGLDRFDPRVGEFRNFDYTNYESETGIGFRRIDAIFEDRGGVLWFGTRGGGLNKLAVRQKGFKSYGYSGGEPHGIPHPTVRSIAGQVTAASESIWIGTDGGGVARLDTSVDHFQDMSKGTEGFSALSDKRVWALLVDRETRVWAGTYADGLFVNDTKNSGLAARQIRHSPLRPDSLSSDRVQVLMEAMDGTIWVGTQAGLDKLTSLDGEASFEHFFHDPADPESLSSSEITALIDGGDGNLWVGTRSGLNQFHQATASARRFYFSPDDIGSLSSNYVTSLARDDRGRIWVGTDSGGLNFFDPSTGQFKRFSDIGAAAGLRISSILIAAENELWLGTGRGLVRFNPESGVAKFFGRSDGLATMSFLPGAAYAARNGEFFMGGLRGLISFDPDSVFENTQPPEIAFTSIMRFDTGDELLPAVAKPGSAPIELAHDEVFLRIEFAATDYMDPSRNSYAHRLQGIDSDWVETGNENSATYTSLAPGRYVFQARAANPDGAWNLEGISQEIIVLPAFWQTWPFRLLMAVLAALIVYASHLMRTAAIRNQNVALGSLNARLLDQISARNRIEAERESLIKELEERNAEMERFTYTVSHDLKSPLITIKGFLGLLRQDTDAARKENAVRDIDRIESATSRMNQLLDELLQFSRAGKSIATLESTDLGEVVKEALNLAQGEIEAAGISVAVADNLPVLMLDRIRMTEALLNLISNAARFMGEQPDPRIEIGMRYDGSNPVYFVKDNGIGLSEAHREKIFELFERLDSKTPGTGIGLALVKRIIENHNGRVWVESAGEGQGATFCFTLNESTSREAVSA
ncbi:MAG: hypothetical protein HKN59_02565 [Gammaproteobacteria bacterium]|nr:hypothetical protein [Gammaproteobacteria bacterium]